MSSLLRFGAKPGLERITRLTDLLGRPQFDYATIHVGGTNGKGSTSLMLARVLTASGYKTGLFVSPHLHSYRERMQINGEMISPDDLAACLEQVDKLLPQLTAEGFSHPTEFEVLTAAAFLYFRQQQVDIAVIEVGMGGLYDSTNIIMPLLSVITNIEMDHTTYLGNNIAEITVNKAGIIKPGVPVITGEKKDEALRVLATRAREQGVELLVAPERVQVKVISSSLYRQKLAVHDGKTVEVEVELGLPGAYQRDNLALVWAALDSLREQGMIIPQSAALEALAACLWPGRLEVVRDEPPVILDAGHNEAGSRALRVALEEMLPDRELVVVWGILDDKDARSFLANLPTQTRAIVITHPDSPRADNWRQRVQLAREYFNEVYEVEAIEAAVQQGLELLKPQEYLLITGSFYILDRARKALIK